MQRKEDHAKFKSLATKRVNKAIKHIRLIGNLSNRSNYAYEDVEVKKIFQALRDEIADAESEFKNAKKEKTKPFTFEVSHEHRSIA